MTRTGLPLRSGAIADELVAVLRSALLKHYDRTRRELPWRGDADPYRIWVSEVMLQQTRVETVIPYYRNWLEQFPNVQALAAADTDAVLLAWQGLGYYRRARNLHAGARLVCERFGGEVPRTSSELRALPGVGEYTAGALASIAFDEPVPAVDGNVKRVFARLLDDPAPGPAMLREVTGRLVDPDRPGDWNQALMDLGATVCMPRRPECGRCPFSRWCGAHAAGTEEDRPARKSRAEVPKSTRVTAVIVDGDENALVERQPEHGLLGGLWAFPSVEAGGEPMLVDLAIGVAKAAGARLDEDPIPVPLAAVRHRFSHLQATYRPVLLRGAGPTTHDRRWIPLGGLRELALPVAQEKIARAAWTMLRG
jgi:A/G-specific adenine glycosylase